MSGGNLLSIQPTELKFPFELKKQSSCSMRLTNKTDHLKQQTPKKYCVRPNFAICDVTVTMQAQKEAPADMQCKDKFLFQSVVAEHGATTKDINSELFNKEAGKAVEEFKLRVVYIPANPPFLRNWRRDYHQLRLTQGKQLQVHLCLILWHNLWKNQQKRSLQRKC